MRCDTGFVVGAAASVESAVAFGRLERWRLPLPRIALRLHIVVGIQQHGRRTGRRGMPRDHGWGTALAHYWHIRCTWSRRAGSAHTDWIRTRFSRSSRTEGNTWRTRSTRSLMVSRLAVVRCAEIDASAKNYDNPARSRRSRRKIGPPWLRKPYGASRMATAAAVS